MENFYPLTKTKPEQCLVDWIHETQYTLFKQNAYCVQNTTCALGDWIAFRRGHAFRTPVWAWSGVWGDKKMQNLKNAQNGLKTYGNHIRAVFFVVLLGDFCLGVFWKKWVFWFFDWNSVFLRRKSTGVHQENPTLNLGKKTRNKTNCESKKLKHCWSFGHNPTVNLKFWLKDKNPHSGGVHMLTALAPWWCRSEWTPILWIPPQMEHPGGPLEVFPYLEASKLNSLCSPARERANTCMHTWISKPKPKSTVKKKEWPRGHSNFLFIPPRS